MGIYVGVNGTPKEVTAVYVGVNGVPKECSDIYVGVNGTPKPCYSGVKPGETVFTSSTNFTVPKGVKKIDVFCVGGGGGGSYDGGGFFTTGGSWGRIEYKCSCGQSSASVAPYTDPGWQCYDGGYLHGGFGAECISKSSQEVTPGQQISITIGAASSYGKGGASSIGSICNANGGDAYGGSNYARGTSYYGGGYGYSYTINYAYSTCSKCGGQYISGRWFTWSKYSNASYTDYDAQAGQYAFGDSSKGLYGCGGGYRNPAANTGDGEGSASATAGCVIIRWDDQKS